MYCISECCCFFFLDMDSQCKDALGMASREITDEQISASSERDKNHAAIQGRINFQRIFKAGAWRARTDNRDQWLQVDLESQYSVWRVATQGRNAWKVDEWVKKYKLLYSNGPVGSFQYYKQLGKNEDKVKKEGG